MQFTSKTNVDPGREETNSEGFRPWLARNIRQFGAGQRLATRYVWADTRRTGRSCLIGLSTVFLVVCFISLLHNSVLQAPMIFFKIAENTAGEMDLVLTPGTGIDNSISQLPAGIPVLNHSMFEQRVQRGGRINGIAPRWLMLSRLRTQSQLLTNPDAQPEPRVEWTPISDASAIVLGIDGPLEEALNIGRSWPYPPLGPAEMILTRSLARDLGFEPPESAVGATLDLGVDLTELLRVLDLIESSDDALERCLDEQESGQGNSCEGVEGDPKSARLVSLSELEALLELIAPAVRQQLLDNAQTDPSQPPLRSVWEVPLDLDPETAQIGFRPIPEDGLLLPIEGLNGVPIRLLQSPRLNAVVLEATFSFPIDGTPVGLVRALELLAERIAQNTGVEVDLVEVWREQTQPDGTIDLNDFLDSAAHSFLLGNVEPSGAGNQTLLGDLAQPFLPWITQLLRLSQSMTVRAVVGSPGGKWPESLGSVALVEGEQFFLALRDNAQELLFVNESNPVMLGPVQPTAAQLTLALNLAQQNGLVDPNDPQVVALRFLLNALPPGAPLTIGPLPVEIPGVGPELSLPALLQQLAGGQLTEEQDAQLRDSLDAANTTIGALSASEFALLTLAQLADRVSTYLKPTQLLTRDMVGFSNQLMEQIGVAYPARVTLPIATALAELQWIRYFLDSVFGSTLALVVGLAVLLVFSLMLADVQSKTYEYGMLRALGMGKRTLVQLILTKSATFAAPGVILGLLVALLASIPITGMISDYAELDPSYGFYPAALASSITVGLVMPIVANVIPIRRALTRTLRDSLDLYHHIVNDVLVSVTRLQDLGLEPWQTSLALLVLVIGFVTFYMVPYAFTFRLFDVFLGILNGILLGMLLGLCILASLVQPWLERLVLASMLFGPCRRHRALFGVVKKNLNGHRPRNGKTAFMFIVALAFVIFAGSMFELQGRSLADNIRVLAGSDLYVFAPSLRDSLREVEMREYLDQQMQASPGSGEPLVRGYTFVTFPLEELAQVREAEFSNLPNYPTLAQSVYGVEAHYQQVVFDSYIDVAHADSMYGNASTGGSPGRVPAPDPRYAAIPTDSQDVIGLMWADANNARLPYERTAAGFNWSPRTIATGWQETPPGVWEYSADTQKNQTEHRLIAQAAVESAYSDYLDVVISAGLETRSSLTLSTPMRLSLESEARRRTRMYLCKARGMVRKLPGFMFSGYSQAAASQPVLIRMDSYQRLMRDAILSDLGLDELPEDYVLPPPPKQRLNIRVRSSATAREREDLLNGVRVYFKSDATLAMNVDALLETTQTAIDMLNVFFQVVGAIAMIMCFFILWLSFIANVRENAWEFGVLRSIGLNSVQVVSLYIYEALALVISGLILGSGIGLAVSSTLTLQFNLFTEMPFVLTFPTDLFLTMLCLSLATAVIGSWLPAKQFLRLSISNVLRRGG